MSTGIDTIDAAPLIIRTYNDDSANNTFLLTQYDYPVSSNYVLRTSDGSMAPSDALTQTTMGLSSMTISKHYGSTMVYDTFNASTLFLPSGVFDTITKNTMTASSITASTIFLNTLNISTINASTFSPNGVSVAYMTIGSTVQASSMVYSTLLGDSLFVNTIGISTMFGSSIYGKSWAASTMVNDNALFSTLTVASTAAGFLSFSTLQGSTLIISTLSGSSIYTNPLTVSTLDGGLLVMSTVGIASTLVVSSLFTNVITVSTTVGSSMTVSTIVVPSLLTNSLVFSTAQGSTLVVSTLTMSSLYVPLVVGSTIQGNELVFSTLLASSMNTANVVYSTAQGSTIAVSTLGVSTLIVGAVAYSTFSGGSMTINTMGVSTVAGSTVSWNRAVFSTIQGSSAIVSSATVSTLVGGVCVALSVQGSTLVVSSLVVSSMNVGGFVGSTLKSDSLFFSTMTVSTLSKGSVVYSTLQGSTITLSTLTFSTLSVSTMGVSTLTGSTMFGNLITVSSIQFEGFIFSTLNGSTLLLSTLTSCTINAQTISVSTLQGSTIGVSTLMSSTIVSGQISYSTLIGSSIVTDYISASTFTGTGSLFISTFSFAAQQTSAAFLSTLIVNSTVTVSTLNRINPTSMTASTLTLSGGLHSNTATGLLVCSTLTVNTMNVTRSIVNQPVYGNTVKTDSIAAPGWSVIRTSGIRATIDAAPSLAQTYYFGPTIPDRWVVAGTQTNAISYSNDGFNWIGLGTTVMNMMRIAIWNGSMWVGVGDVGSISPAKSGLTANTWTQSGVTWTATASSTLSGWPIYTAFDGSLGSDGNAWAAGATNYNSAGTYTGAITTTVNGIPVGLTFPSPSAGTSVAGDWLQIQLSTPLSILSYKWGCANASNQAKSFCLVGSNDGTTWYFIQYVSYPSSPCTVAYTNISTVISASYTGVQTVTGNASVNATTTSSMYSGNLYTYFRMIGIQMFSGSGAMYMETGEWSITFSQSTIAYSYDGIKWTGLGTTIFTSFGLEVAWNGSMWVAVGGGFNSIAYSYDGINWTGLGKSILTNYGHAIAWNGTMWVVPGAGSNTLAYSYDGINWIGLGATTFTEGGYGVAWNGRMWIAVGGGTNSIAYSYDGILWVGLGTSILSTGVGAAWNGTMWVILSGAATTIAYSYDGLNWISEGNNGTINARYVRFEYSNALVSRYLQIAGVRVYNAAGTNIITTSMTVTASSNSGTPVSNVLDGDNGTFFHSNLETSPWIEIDLGSEQVIHKVEFVNRGDCCRGRIAGARLVLKNNSGTVVYTSNTMTLKDGVTTTYQDYPGNEGYLYYNWWPVISTYAYGSDTSPFMFEMSAFTGARKLAWNGNMWLAGGGGINSLAYSYNGINWIGLGNVLGSSVVCMATAFNSARPHQITFPVSMMVATGSGTNTLAYSADGILWTGNGLGVFSTQGNGVASNGSMWVATGSGTNTLAYSTTDIETPYIYLPFENGLYKDIMGNSTTVVYGAPMFIPGVRGSSAVNFVNTAGGTGTNYIKVPWAGSTSFSISFCFNAQTISGVQQNIFTNTSGNLCFYIRPSTNTLGFYIPRGGALVGTDAAITSYAISANTWYNVTGIFQTYGLCSLYVNNTLVGSSTNIGGLGTGTMDMWIGSWQTSTPFNGFIDDIRIYNYAITMNPKITWRGLGTSVFSTQGKGVAWNGSMWVAVGGGTNSIAYSYDGITWFGLGTDIFTQGNGVAWNGSMWVAVGNGTNSIAYSSNGTMWTGLGTSIFSGSGNGIAWNGSMWVAVGSGTNTIAYSYNGTIWTGLGTTLFSSSGNGIAWNNRWVAVGAGTNTILYSTNGINWTSAAVSCFTTAGNGVTWNGSTWIATGSGTNTIGYSVDGSTWNKSQNITPNQTGLASNTWTQNGITWVSSASSIINSSYSAYGAFNNYYGSLGVYSWASPVFYNVSDGLYTGSASTMIQAGVGSKTGEWLQIQSSVPLVLSSYTYGCGANGQVPKTYYIVGSNDNTNWYPIQSCVMSVNPLTAYFTVCTTYIVVNQSGTQTIFGGQTGSGTFTTYPPYTTTAYTYFRIILQTLWNSGTNGNAEFGEFYPNFNAVDNISLTNYVSYGTTAYGGASVITSTRNPNAYQITLVAASSQYLQTPSFISTTNGLTFSFWYKSNALSGAWQRIFDFGNGASSDNILCSPNSSDGTLGRLEFMCFSGGNSSNFLLTDNNYNDNVWRHVTWTLVYAAAGSATSTWNIYLNGVLKTTATAKYYPSTSVTRTSSYIGRSNWGDPYYNGIIDDFRIYNTVLTAQEVNTIYLGSGYGVIFSGAGSNIASNSLSGSVNIQHPVVAVGQGVHTLAYSPDGIRWTGLGTTMFNGAGYSVAWNGTRWVAGGLGSNTLAYSYDGLRWTGLGATIFSAQVNGIAWNGSIWVAVGAGSNAIAYSADGLSWIGSPSANAIFTSCNAVAWNGAQWVAVGAGTNSIAVSTDGFVWNAYGSTVFSTQGNGVYWTGSLWVAVGTGTNTIAYSTNNGISWTGLGTFIFSTSGNGVCWNGTRWVAVGSGTNTIAYSSNGTSWVGLGTSLFPVSGNGVCWTGTRFVAVGDTVGYSTDGLTWYVGSNNVFTQGNGVAGNPRIGAVVCDSQVALSDSTTLDVVSDTYYNTGYTNFSAAIQAYTYTVDPTSIATVVKTLPGAPTNVVGATYPAGAVIGIRVSFTYPSNTGGGVEAYYASAIDTAGLQPTVTVSSVTQPISLTTGLIPGTTYRFQVYSSNSAGQSIATVSASNLLFQIPPSAPQNYVVALDPPTNPTSIVVSFTAPSNLGGGITNYTVTPTLGSAQTGLALSYTFTGFTAGTSYTFSTAGYNTGGTGAAAITSITYYTKPDAPTVTGITLDPVGAPTGVNVAFTSGSNGGGVLTYVATAYDSNSAVVSSTTGNTSPLKITGLTLGMSYTYRVVASNVAVSSTASVAFGPVMYQLLKPDAPSILSVTFDPPATPTGIRVAFTTNGNNGGGTLTYAATAYDSNSVVVSSMTGSTSPIKITGLTPGTSYTFKVVASNISMSSDASTPSASVKYYTNPSAPTNIAVSSAGVITWTAPTNDGLGSSTQFTSVVTSNPSGYTSEALAYDVTTATQSGLTLGNNYIFTITVTNTSGATSSASSNSTAIGGGPSVPTSLSVSQDGSTLGRVTVTWSAPANNNGSAVTNYYVKISGSYVPTNSTTSPQSYTFTGLTGNTSYTFYVYAVNGFGAGIVGSLAFTTNGVPNAPAAATFYALRGPDNSYDYDDNYIGYYYTIEGFYTIVSSGTQNGGTIVSYRLRFSDGADSVSTWAQVSGYPNGIASFQYLGPINTRPSSVQVFATNTYGESPGSTILYW